MVLFESKAFVAALSLVVATVVSHFWPELAVTAAKVEGLLLSVLLLLGVVPELRAAGKAHRLPAFLRGKEELKKSGKK